MQGLPVQLESLKMQQHMPARLLGTALPPGSLLFPVELLQRLGLCSSAWLRASLEALPYLCHAVSQPLLKAAEHKKQLWSGAMCWF